MKVIGHIRTDFPSKFGIPRQSGLIDGLKGKIILEPEYRNPQVYKGIEEFSHIWLLWEFSEAKKEHWSATVKPPRLGGKKRMGVFGHQSPVPSQQHRSFLCEIRPGRAGRERRPGAVGGGCRSVRRDPHL